MTKRILTIAGSDSIAGGGIQADLATFSKYGIFAFSALTSIVTVSSDSFEIEALSGEMVKKQLDSIEHFTTLDAIKIGLLPTIEIIKIVGEFLKGHRDSFIVCDPVMVFKETSEVSTKEYAKALEEHIFPYADLITPNLEEAKILAEKDISFNQIEDVKKIAKAIWKKVKVPIVVKGGERLSGHVALDVLFDGQTYTTFNGKKIPNSKNNGSGCTFSSAIAANLANGFALDQSIKKAKGFVWVAISNGVQLNDEIGNVNQSAVQRVSNYTITLKGE